MHVPQSLLPRLFICFGLLNATMQLQATEVELYKKDGIRALDGGAYIHYIVNVAGKEIGPAVALNEGSTGDLEGIFLVNQFVLKVTPRTPKPFLVGTLLISQEAFDSFLPVKSDLPVLTLYLMQGNLVLFRHTYYGRDMRQRNPHWMIHQAKDSLKFAIKKVSAANGALRFKLEKHDGSVSGALPGDAPAEIIRSIELKFYENF